MTRIVAIALFFGLFSAQAAEPLFQEIAAPRAASELEPTVLRERHVVLTTTTFAESVRLNLFDGTELEFERSKVRRQALGGEVWQGVDGKGGRAYLSTVGQAVAGTIWADGKLFELRHRGDGRHVVTEVDIPANPALVGASLHFQSAMLYSLLPPVIELTNRSSTVLVDP